MPRCAEHRQPAAYRTDSTTTPTSGPCCDASGTRSPGCRGLEHLRRHVLRHTGLTWMADAGIPVHVPRSASPVGRRGALPRRQRAGCWSRTGLSDSSSEAMCRIVDSACQLATTCTATGMPALLVPNRIDRAGSPLRLKGTVVDLPRKVARVLPPRVN